MIRKLSLLILSISLLSTSQLSAQKSSKSKSSDKLYERDQKNKPVRINNVKTVNSDQIEFSPQFYQNGIVYVKSNPETDNKYELYYSEFGQDGTPGAPERFQVHVSSNVHEGPVSFSRDLQTLYYSTNSNSSDTDSNNDGKKDFTVKIYQANRSTHDWKNVVELPFNSEAYFCFHPSLSPDGSKLYFTSNMPGGFGGTDLYVVEKYGNNWGVPQNLGPNVNTSENEAFPFIHESGNLFFSSKGHGAIGGYDIFLVDVSTRRQNPVTKLNPPFNTVMDDFGLVLNSEGNKGFFSSGRNGGAGADDIYSFIAPDGLLHLSTEIKGEVTIKVVDKTTNKPVRDAKIRVLEEAEDGYVEGDDVYDIEMIPNPNDPDELVFKLVRKNASDFKKGVKKTRKDGESIFTLTSGKKHIILVSKEGYDNTEQIYVPRFTQGNEYDVVIPISEIACVTVLGEVSADNFRSGVPGVNLIIKNDCDGTTHKVESSTGGNFEICLPVGCDYSISAKKTGYKSVSEKISLVGKSAGETVNSNLRFVVGEDPKETPVAAVIDLPKKDAPEEKMLKESIETGDVIELRNIYYDFGKSTIRSGAARDLDALVTLMTKYNSMEIELISHTDSRGSVEFNQNLSLKRAESAKRYLVSRGIAESRISAFGYGEDEPRNHCIDGADCTEEEFEYNRRTEVRITRIDRTIKVNYKVNKP